MWFVYLLRCSDNTFYIGITNNLEKRLQTHNDGRGAKYTRGRCPCVLVRVIECENKSAALKLEAKWKRIRRDKKTEFEG
jgi:putative endonuclease